jgi:hypothetical protein
MIAGHRSDGRSGLWWLAHTLVLSAIVVWPAGLVRAGDGGAGGGEGASAAALGEMQRLAANAKKATYTVSYVTTFLDSHAVKEITSFRRGPKLRVDQGVNRNFFDAGSKIYTTCSQEGRKPGKYSCNAVPGMIDNEESFRSGEEDPSVLDGEPSWATVAEYAEVAPRPVLGVKARCFTVSMVPDRILIETRCLHPDSGVLLFGEGTGNADTGARMTTEATAYSTGVTDADVTPPGR